jgi:hypothetical protein
MRRLFFVRPLLFCILRAPGAPSYYLQKGNELSAGGKQAEASLNYRRAIQTDPKLAEAYYSGSPERGVIHRRSRTC